MITHVHNCGSPKCRRVGVGRCAVQRENGKLCKKWICFVHNRGPLAEVGYGREWVCSDCIGRVTYTRRPATKLPNYVGKLKGSAKGH